MRPGKRNPYKKVFHPVKKEMYKQVTLVIKQVPPMLSHQ
jgi:hypothetical protein